MKIDRHGRAKILKQRFSASLLKVAGAVAGPYPVRCLPGIQPAASTNASPCKREMFDDSRSRVRPEIIIREQHQGQAGSATIPVIEDLRIRLQSITRPSQRILFPGRRKGHLHPGSARFLREACRRVASKGVSTHSFGARR